MPNIISGIDKDIQEFIKDQDNTITTILILMYQETLVNLKSALSNNLEPLIIFSIKGELLLGIIKDSMKLIIIIIFQVIKIIDII